MLTHTVPASSQSLFQLNHVLLQGIFCHAMSTWEVKCLCFDAFVQLWQSYQQSKRKLTKLWIQIFNEILWFDIAALFAHTKHFNWANTDENTYPVY